MKCTSAHHSGHYCTEQTRMERNSFVTLLHGTELVSIIPYLHKLHAITAVLPCAINYSSCWVWYFIFDSK